MLYSEDFLRSVPPTLIAHWDISLKRAGDNPSMKTIFISMFEGVEVKNILRTDVVPTLLSDPEVRLVLLMKNEVRVELYRKEFNDPRIIYEVVPYVRSLGRGLDRIFATLKYTLLRTKTTDLRRRLSREAGKPYVVYAFERIVNVLLARPSVRKMVRFLDLLLVRNTLYASVFDSYAPDLVLLAHLFEEPEIHILREAKRRKIKSIGFVNSWDKVTARCIMRLLPDRAIVFNELVKQQMVSYNEMREENITVTGIPQYDFYHEPVNTSRETFCKRAGIDPRDRIIVYAPFGSTFSASDWDTIDFLHTCVKEKLFGPRISLLVRFQPNDFVDEHELRERPDLHYDYPGKRFTSTRGVDWDMTDADIQHLKDTLHYMDVLICYASSLSVDAVVFDKPVINISFEFKKPPSPLKSPTIFYGTAHYTEALRSGGIRLVHSERELVEWVGRYLKDPSVDREGRARLAKEQIQFFDGRAGERMGKFILANLR